jgi:hypothetical protein
LGCGSIHALDMPDLQRYIGEPWRAGGSKAFEVPGLASRSFNKKSEK